MAALERRTKHVGTAAICNEALRLVGARTGRSDGCQTCYRPLGRIACQGIATAVFLTSPSASREEPVFKVSQVGDALTCHLTILNHLLLGLLFLGSFPLFLVDRLPDELKNRCLTNMRCLPQSRAGNGQVSCLRSANHTELSVIYYDRCHTKPSD